MFGTAASLAGIQNRLIASMRNWAMNSQTRLSTSGIETKNPKRRKSATTIVLRRSNRSANAPASGPSTMAGRSRKISTAPRAKFLPAKLSTSEVAVAVIASRPSQSPKLDSAIDSQSRRKSRTRRTARIFATRPTAPISSPGCSSASGARASAGTGAPPGGRPSGGTAVRSSGCAAGPSTGGCAGRGGSNLIGAPGSEGGGGSRPPGHAHGTGRGRRFPALSANGRGGCAPRFGLVTTAWDPATYLRFADERARPFIELLARVRGAAPSAVIDLGCGEGALTASLAGRWPGARITGVDSSPEMLAAAAPHALPGRVSFTAGDVRDWAPSEPVDLLVSNAVLHWVPGHERLLARWAGQLAPGGELAVQVPGNFREPTHALLAGLCATPRWAGRLAGAAPRPDAVAEPAGYLDVLTAAGLAADVWETTYLHVLTGEDPVLRWVSSTVLRPALAPLGPAEAAALTEEYAAALREAYPRRPDGTTLLPFRRVFAVGTRPG